MTAGNDVATVEGLNQKGSCWFVRIIATPDLIGVHSKTQLHPALDSSDS